LNIIPNQIQNQPFLLELILGIYQHTNDNID
jgi:hypothetical protein